MANGVERNASIVVGGISFRKLGAPRPSTWTVEAADAWTSTASRSQIRPENGHFCCRVGGHQPPNRPHVRENICGSYRYTMT